jgi:hypothetical protein
MHFSMGKASQCNVRKAYKKFLKFVIYILNVQNNDYVFWHILYIYSSGMDINDNIVILRRRSTTARKKE